MSAPENKKLIADAFDAWTRGEGNVFDLLADDMSWEITGSSPVAGVYTSRQDFLDRAIAPISARLSQPIRPTVRTMVADGDTVAVVWDGEATAVDGSPYNNTYAWVMRIADGRITEVTAFFDTPLLSELLSRSA